MRSLKLYSSVWPLLMALVVVSMAIAASPAQAARKVSEDSPLQREALDSTGLAWKAEQEADRIVALPGQPKVEFAMYAGYVTVNKEAGRALYYYFVEAQQEPEAKPLVFWFNGGPGCSSIAFGFAEELGPFHINSGGKTLRLNPYAANRVANVLFVDSPAGVGFSYTNTSNDLSLSGDNRTAHDNYAFVVNWMERFPQYKGRPFYLTGESYAGNYVPQLSKLIYENNKNLSAAEKINFKGFMLGNPVIDTYYDVHLGYIDSLYYNSLISDQLYAQIKTVCIFQHENATVSNECRFLLNAGAESEFGRIDPYAIYAPACVNGTSIFGQINSTLRFNPVHFRQGYDACTYNHAAVYFNTPEVQKAMHVHTTRVAHQWSGCSLEVSLNWQDRATTVLPLYRELLEAGLRLWVYSGDTDIVVPTLGTRYALASLNLTVAVPWYPWYHRQQVGGREIVYEGNLTLVTVRGAGHEVPKLRSPEFLQIFRSFLDGALLPRAPYY